MFKHIKGKEKRKANQCIQTKRRNQNKAFGLIPVPGT